MKPINKITVCGGSPSHTILPDRPIIITNRDITRYPDADYFITCDISFTRRNKEEIRNFRGTTVFVNDTKNEQLAPSDISGYDVFINLKHQDHFGLTFNEFNTGCNSGFCAVQLAIILGYTEIHIHGIDYKFIDGKSHWHNGYGHPREFLENKYDEYFEKFKKARELLYEIRPDIKFIVHSEVSRLKEIPYVQ